MKRISLTELQFEILVLDKRVRVDDELISLDNINLHKLINGGIVKFRNGDTQIEMILQDIGFNRIDAILKGK